MGNVVNVRKIQKAIKRKQETINKLSNKLKTAPKYIFAGWDTKSGTYPEQDRKPVSYIAEIHDKGLGYQTRKDMVARTTNEYGESWQKLYIRLVNKYIKKGKNPDLFKVSEKVGERMRDDLRNYIYIIDLVDTERLANSIIVRYRRR